MSSRSIFFSLKLKDKLLSSQHLFTTLFLIASFIYLGLYSIIYQFIKYVEYPSYARHCDKHNASLNDLKK